MPKDTSRVLPPKPTLDLNAARRDTTLRRQLPQAVFDRLQHGRDTGRPYKYTTRDVQAIVHYTSGAGRISDPRTHRWPTQQQYDQHRAAARSFAERIGDEKKKSLADRIERPPLIARLAPPTAEFARPKPILSDFDKYTPEQRARIFNPRLAATCLRLRPVYDLGQVNPQPDIRYLQDVLDLCRLFDGFNLLRQAPTITTAQWHSLEHGLKRIGQVSFKGLRKNYDRIILDLC